MIQHLRVGIPVISSQILHDGHSYIELLVKTIVTSHYDRPQLFLVITEESLKEFSVYSYLIELFEGVIFVGESRSYADEMIGLDFIHYTTYDVLFSKIDFYFSIFGNYLEGTFFRKRYPLSMPITHVLPIDVFREKTKEETVELSELYAERFNDIVEKSQFAIWEDYFEKKKLCLVGRSDEITIATSLAPSKNLDDQKMVIHSWQELGFKVVSINAPEEIKLLKMHFKEIEFIVAHRDARNIFDKPFIYFDDFLAYFSTSESRICGIVNSDIHLYGDNLYSFIRKAAVNSLVYGARVDVETVDDVCGEVAEYGFDYFFFDKQIIPYYPSSEFFIGLPWWDYWIVTIPLFYRIAVKKVMTPYAYHVRHQLVWDEKLFWMMLLEGVFDHIKLMIHQPLHDAPKYIIELVNKYSEISFEDDYDKVSGDQGITRIITEDIDGRMIDNLMLKLRLKNKI